MQKVGCTKCGAMILPATAEKNGGVCMACKAGIRESIEQSKKYYEEQRELDRTDPERLYWQDLARRVDEPGGGFASLSEVEKRYFAVHVLHWEVNNGGFDQFFNNHSGEYYLEACAGLLELGAQNALRTLREAKVQLFGASQVPVNTEARRRYLAAHPVADDQRLHDLDRSFWADSDGLQQRLSQYAAAHNLLMLPHNHSLQARRP